MVVSYHENVGENDILLVTNESFDKLGKFKYLGTTVNFMHK